MWTYIKQLVFFLNEKINGKQENIILLEKNVDSNLSISFIIDKENNIDILFDIPYDENIDSDELIKLSEKYAELLVGINYGLLNNQIISTLKQKSKESENTNQILLIDNILSFYGVLKKDMLRTSVLYNQPVISPSMVFNNKG